MNYSRGDIQRAYARVCEDSGYRIDFVAAGQFVAKLLNISYIDVRLALGYDGMKDIASGRLPTGYAQ